MGLLGSKPLFLQQLSRSAVSWSPGCMALLPCSLVNYLRAGPPFLLNHRPTVGPNAQHLAGGRSALCAGPGPGLGIQPGFDGKVSSACKQLTLRPQVYAFSSPYGLCVLFLPGCQDRGLQTVCRSCLLCKIWSFQKSFSSRRLQGYGC